MSSPLALMAHMRNMRAAAPMPPAVAVGEPIVSGVPLVSNPIEGVPCTSDEGRLPDISRPAAGRPPDVAAALAARETPAGGEEAAASRPVHQRLPELSPRGASQAAAPARTFVRVTTERREGGQPGGTALRCADGDIRHGSRVKTRHLQILNKYMRAQPARSGPWSYGRIGSLNTFYNQVSAHTAVLARGRAQWMLPVGLTLRPDRWDPSSPLPFPVDGRRRSYTTTAGRGQARCDLSSSPTIRGGDSSQRSKRRPRGCTRAAAQRGVGLSTHPHNPRGATGGTTAR
eukprot:261956-Prymnesium_polylepis.1